MGLFSKSLDTCSVCDAGIERGKKPSHNVQHAIPAPDGGGGYAWECKCGERDGVWDQPMGAAAALTLHMQNRHGLRFP
jgi:hypothetical protein